ncbi:uncharacterized protein cubi_00848 [Cryptosporidium ubiquitum]|uniref:Uncharacterized protein n=1 Tax=Cryptosporidium ubiquitum TaxID=857276 RepID=A0A1J4MIL6_9CRYT|nr:uncharacterized protein cubi_00848 [Cryptosporidium ubiquitum]OII72876.1 hypothetical protein cubi_00848 [Cryptosporidium ubiquitum]
MSGQKVVNNICGFEKKSLDIIKTNLETLLSRKHILDNAVIQECFNKDILGFSLDSVSNLEELKEISSSLLGKDPSSGKKELMLAICLGAGISNIFNISVYSEEGNEIDLDVFHSNENKKLDEDELMNNLLDASKLIMEFLETGREKDIFIKPIFKAERTTLILRDLENDVIEDEIFDLLKKCPHFYSLEAASNDKTAENSTEAVRKLVVDFRKEVHGTWFITLKTEDLTTKVALWLRSQKLRDHNSSPIKVGIKSEHPIASLLSVLSMSKSPQYLSNRMNNLQISGSEVSTGIAPMVATLHASLPNRPPIISGNELGGLNTGNCLIGVEEATADGLPSHKGVVMGGVSPKMGYMMNISGYSNNKFIQSHPQINGAGLENQQPPQGAVSEPQKAMDSLSSQNHEHMATPVPMMYQYHRGIGRAIEVPNPTNHLNIYGSILGAPNGGVIAPIVVVPGTTMPGTLPASTPSSPIMEINSPNICKTDAPESTEADYPRSNSNSPKRHEQKRRGSRTSEFSDSDARNLSPNNSSNRRNSRETISSVLAASEVDNCVVSPVIDGINSVIRGIPQGATTLIHGITPFYYGVSGLPEVQPVNLQYIGVPHPGSHPPHVFIHGNPQLQYQHQMDIGISGSGQGNPVNFESGPSNPKLDSETNKFNGQHNLPRIPAVFPTGYYQNTQYIGEDSFGFIGSHRFPVGNFAFNNAGTLISAGGVGNTSAVPENLVNQGQNFWVSNPANSNNTGNQRFKFNNRKNNGSSGSRAGTKTNQNSKKNNHLKLSGNGGNPENPNFVTKVGSKTGAVSQLLGNDSIPKHAEIDQNELAEACSTNSSKQDPNYKKENPESFPSERHAKDYPFGAGEPTNDSSHAVLNENNQNQSCKKLQENSSELTVNELPGKQQAFGKIFKSFVSSGNKSKGQRNGKKSSNSNGTSANKKNFEHNEYQSNANNDKSKAFNNAEGNNGPQCLEAKTGVSDHHRRRTSKQMNPAGNVGGDHGSFIQGKYNGYENNHFRVKRTIGNEQSHFNFNNHGKHSGGNLNGTGGSNGHVNQIGSHKSKGQILRSNDQEAKGIGLDNFPSLSDAIAIKK